MAFDGEANNLKVLQFLSDFLIDIFHFFVNKFFKLKITQISRFKVSN